MKKIKNATIANPFNDGTIEVTYDFRRDATGKPILDDRTGEPLYPITTPQTTALVVRTFVSGFPAKDASMDDSHKCLRILDALRPFKLLQKIDPEHVVPATIDLEDSEYDWLVAKYKAHGPQVSGVAFAALYLKAIEDAVDPKKAVEEPKKQGKILSAGKA